MQLAVDFAKALQCEEFNGKACGHCKSCKQTDSKNQPDIKYVTYEKSGIGVDEIREQINDDIDIKPYSSRYKIYIVDESEKMTVQAQNALLKTIEEPPGICNNNFVDYKCRHIFANNLSRCVVLNIRPVKEELIKNKLMSEYGIGAYEASMAAVFSGGNPGKAVELATSEDFKDLKNHVVGALLSLEKGGMDIISNNVKEAASFKKQIDEYFSLIRIWFRDVLLYKASKSDDKLVFQDDYKLIEEMSEKIDYYGINIILQQLDKAQSRIKSNVNFDVTMEVLFLAIKERMNDGKGNRS